MTVRCMRANADAIEATALLAYTIASEAAADMRQKALEIEAANSAKH